MRRVRRYDLSPRVELTPLIDVVFLLLTFFIVAMVVLVQVRTTGVTLASVEGGGEAETDALVLIELGRSGQIAIDGRAVPDDELDAALVELAQRPDRPPVVLTVESGQGDRDRVEQYMQLIGRIERAGIEEIQFPEFDQGETGAR
ncbi:biopolymer transporter ExbD [Phycisphaeraceae bacterium D3-23]